MGLKDRITNSKPSERQIEEVISRGGTVAAALQKKRSKTSNFPLRFMLEDMPDRINAAMAKRQIKPSMNVWINEAILHKLKNEE